MAPTRPLRRESNALTHRSMPPLGDDVPDTGLPERYERVARFKTRARIVFVGTCWIGNIFRNMWELGSATGPRALVTAEAVNASPGALINLNRAAEAWKAVLRRLTGGPVARFKPMTVGDAVAEVNLTDITMSHPATETHFVLKVIGDTNAKIR